MTTPRRILFVEPDDTQKQFYLATLKPEENDWQFIFASSAMDAVEKNHEYSFDMVVTHNRLPDESGLRLLERVRETHPKTIRFLLVDEAEKAGMRSMVSSAQQVLTKPIELKPFSSQVKRALALRELVHGNPANLEVLGDTDALPPLPRIFQELSRMLSNSRTPLQDVAELISQDIALSSQILKMANSALFNLREPVQSVMQAVPLLGSSAISSLVFSQSMGNTFKSNASEQAFLEELNSHSIACATATTRILSSWGADKELIEKSIFCGIAHDLGKLMFVRYAPEKWRQVQEELMLGEQTELELERAIIGLTHSDLAAYLLARWGFSDEQIIAIGFLHEPSRFCESERGLLCALHIAENCCEPEPEKQNFDWAYLEENQISLDDLDEIKAMLGYETSCQV